MRKHGRRGAGGGREVIFFCGFRVTLLSIHTSVCDVIYECVLHPPIPDPL